MAEIEVKDQRSCEIWQSLKKDLNHAHGFVIFVRRKLIFVKIMLQLLLAWLCPFGDQCSSFTLY